MGPTRPTTSTTDGPADRLKPAHSPTHVTIGIVPLRLLPTPSIHRDHPSARDSPPTLAAPAHPKHSPNPSAALWPPRDGYTGPGHRAGGRNPTCASDVPAPAYPHTPSSRQNSTEHARIASHPRSRCPQAGRPTGYRGPAITRDLPQPTDPGTPSTHPHATGNAQISVARSQHHAPDYLTGYQDPASPKFMLPDR